MLWLMSHDQQKNGFYHLPLRWVSVSEWVSECVSVCVCVCVYAWGGVTFICSWSHYKHIFSPFLLIYYRLKNSWIRKSLSTRQLWMLSGFAAIALVSIWYGFYLSSYYRSIWLLTSLLLLCPQYLRFLVEKDDQIFADFLTDVAIYKVFSFYFCFMSHSD